MTSKEWKPVQRQTRQRAGAVKKKEGPPKRPFKGQRKKGFRPN